jgi:endonuclease YncB( thermonuclease family)
MDDCDNKFILKSHGVGKYGRCLGVVFIDGENINKRLIKEGLAKKY